MKRPSFQFYPGDWLNDAALRACSVGARGFWIDMLCLMHQGSDYGYLKVNHRPILPANLARMLGATLPDVEGWLDELESFGVFSRDEEGCIMSRRMIRDESIRQSRAAGGSLGGNPALKGKKKDEGKGDEKVNLPPNLKPTPSSSIPSSSSTGTDVPVTPRASRLDKEWVLPVDWAAWARAERPDLDVDDVAARFKDYWVAKPGKDGCKLDWLATWRNWVRNSKQGLRRAASAHSGFAGTDYRKGINDDGSFE
jgi:hypothetical protein